MIGWIFGGVGAALAAGGYALTRKFSAVANYSGIGGFTVTPGGCLYFVGVLMVIVGLCSVVVGVMVSL